MDKEGMLPDFMREMEWEKLDLVTISEDLMRSLEEYIGRFFKTHDKAELYRWAQETRAMLYPVSTAQDLLENTQLADRKFWTEVEHPELEDTIIYPGAWARVPGIDLGTRRRAPLIGEHNREIYEGELAIPPEKLAALKEAAVI
jgi:crotonobetainyl-CoA:carnitine CoA-transferase CaiB-like acyl-CoA transferase